MTRHECSITGGQQQGRIFQTPLPIATQVFLKVHLTGKQLQC